MSRSFPELAERVLIAGMLAGIVMIAQRYSIDVFRWGLGLLVAATFLQIAVGNLPRDASVRRSLVFIVAILATIVGVFAVGIWLVPMLSMLGR
jgi:hypothetical protein